MLPAEQPRVIKEGVGVEVSPYALPQFHCGKSHRDGAGGRGRWTWSLGSAKQAISRRGQVRATRRRRVGVGGGGNDPRALNPGGGHDKLNRTRRLDFQGVGGASTGKKAGGRGGELSRVYPPPLWISSCLESEFFWVFFF